MLEKQKKEAGKERLVYSDPIQVAMHLRNAPGVQITDKNITVVRNSIGIKAWGMCDFLCHFAGYTVSIVEQKGQKGQKK